MRTDVEAPGPRSPTPTGLRAEALLPVGAKKAPGQRPSPHCEGKTQIGAAPALPPPPAGPAGSCPISTALHRAAGPPCGTGPFDVAVAGKSCAPPLQRERGERATSARPPGARAAQPGRSVSGSVATSTSARRPVPHLPARGSELSPWSARAPGSSTGRSSSRCGSTWRPVLHQRRFRLANQRGCGPKPQPADDAARQVPGARRRGPPGPSGRGDCAHPGAPSSVDGGTVLDKKKRRPARRPKRKESTSQSAVFRHGHFPHGRRAAPFLYGPVHKPRRPSVLHREATRTGRRDLRVELHPPFRPGCALLIRSVRPGRPTAALDPCSARRRARQSASQTPRFESPRPTAPRVPRRGPRRPARRTRVALRARRVGALSRTATTRARSPGAAPWADTIELGNPTRGATGKVRRLRRPSGIRYLEPWCPPGFPARCHSTALRLAPHRRPERGLTENRRLPGALLDTIAPHATVFALRGATSVERNDAAAIPRRDHRAEIASESGQRTKLLPGAPSMSCISTVTATLDAEFPAVAAARPSAFLEARGRALCAAADDPRALAGLVGGVIPRA